MSSIDSLNKKIDALQEQIGQRNAAHTSTQAVFTYRMIDNTRVINNQEAYELRLARGWGCVVIPDNGR